MGRYKLPRGPYERHPSTPKEAALRHVIAERYKDIETRTIVENIPSVLAFPAFLDDINAISYRKDGSLSLHMLIPPSFIDDIYKYLPYYCGNPMAVTMEIIKVSYADLTDSA